MEQRIIKVLDQIAAAPDNNDWSDKKWTFQIKTQIARIGKEQKYSVYASQADNVDGGEWLYDLVWLDYKNDELINAYLLLESECWPKEINDDFEKLLLGKAELKVMIFYAKDIKTFKEQVDKMKEKIKNFKHSISGEKYLFSAYVNETKSFLYDNHVVN